MDQANMLTIQWSGDPKDSLVETSIALADLGDKEVRIQMLAAPINPSDLNTIEGVYPLKPAPPGVGGHEGVGKVEAVGSSCTKLKVGDMVVPIASAQGTWRSRGNFEEDLWHAVPSELPIVDAATLAINPGTALCMLEHFVELKEGDCIVQNGANSAVGQYVIQMAKKKKVKTINIVRDRPGRDFSTVEKMLKDKGADLVVTPENAREAAKSSGFPEPKLALNCVGGEVATTMAKMLANGGYHVTYGAMAKQPVIIPPPLLIFKDIHVVGFWISGTMSQTIGVEGKAALFDRLAKMVVDGDIAAPEAMEHIAFSDWQDAFKKAQGDAKSKVLLVMHTEDGAQVNVTPPKPADRTY